MYSTRIVLYFIHTSHFISLYTRKKKEKQFFISKNEQKNIQSFNNCASKSDGRSVCINNGKHYEQCAHDAYTVILKKKSLFVWSVELDIEIVDLLLNENRKRKKNIQK